MLLTRSKGKELSSTMTYTSIRYQTYADYLDSDLGSEGNFRLMSNGEVIELPPEDEENSFVADELAEVLKRLLRNRRLVKSSSTELQVYPVGDNRVNRKPDVIVLRPEHLEQMAAMKKNTILFTMAAPMFVAEIVSPGHEKSDNYRRDYEWKRQQYEWWQIPEYWMIDRHRQQVVVLMLINGQYTEHVYRPSDGIRSSIFPELNLSAEQLLSGNLF